MALNNTAGSASSFFASLFSSRSPATHTDNDAKITDWELVNNSDFSDDDLVDIFSDSDSETASTLIFVDDVCVKDNLGSLAVVGIMSYDGVPEKKESVEEEEDLADPESDEGEEDYNYDLDDELVPWSVSDRFGRQRMRKLGTRSFAKMNKTTKKFAYTVNRPGCVRGKHGLGRKG